MRAVTPFRCGKMQAVQALRVFNKTIRAFSHFPSRVCFFSHLLQKKKLTQSCEFFLLETGVDILSRTVSASYIALFFAAPQNVRRVARPSRDVFLLRRENLSAPVLRVLIKLSARSLIFPPQIVYLAVHGNLFSSDTKQKAHTNV